MRMPSTGATLARGHAFIAREEKVVSRWRPEEGCYVANPAQKLIDRAVNQIALQYKPEIEKSRANMHHIYCSELVAAALQHVGFRLAAL